MVDDKREVLSTFLRVCRSNSERNDSVMIYIDSYPSSSSHSTRSARALLQRSQPPWLCYPWRVVLTSTPNILTISQRIHVKIQVFKFKMWHSSVAAQAAVLAEHADPSHNLSYSTLLLRTRSQFQNIESWFCDLTIIIPRVELKCW